MGWERNQREVPVSLKFTEHCCVPLATKMPCEQTVASERALRMCGGCGGGGGAGGDQTKDSKLRTWTLQRSGGKKELGSFTFQEVELRLSMSEV